MNKDFWIKVSYDGTLLIVREGYNRGRVFNRNLRFHGHKLTASTRKRFLAFIEAHEWAMEDCQDWSWDLDGNYCDEYDAITPSASGGDDKAKHYMRYLVWSEAQQNAHIESEKARSET